MKRLRAAIVGVGDRGLTMGDYSLLFPEELSVVALADTNPVHLETGRKRYRLGANACFNNLRSMLDSKIPFDVVIDATMDQAHYETAMMILDRGYNLILEKPIVNNREQLLDIQKNAERCHAKVLICHVLRYAPFYRRIKEIIDSGRIGTIQTMELNEHVWIAHFLDSFVRGKWGSQANCGSSFLLQKSCHDMDLICWLNNRTSPKKVSSFGTRALFVPENAPKDAPEFCYRCPHNDTCYYSAQKVHLDFDSLPFQTWVRIGKPYPEITKEEKEEFLKHDDYGRCAYKIGDINDRQSVQVEFANGSIATFLMVGGTMKADRYLHVVCSGGEIEGHFGDNAFCLRTLDQTPGRFQMVEERIDLSKEVEAFSDGKAFGGHGGGDIGLMREAMRYFRGEKPSASLSSLQDSINSHLIVFAAERSVSSGKAEEL